MATAHRDVPIASSLVVVLGTAFVILGLAFFVQALMTAPYDSLAVPLVIIAILCWMLIIGIREFGVLAERWDSPLARPALWSALTGLLLVSIVRGFEAGTETTACTEGVCSTWRDAPIPAEIVVAVFKGFVILTFVASAAALFTTLRSMRSAA